MRFRNHVFFVTFHVTIHQLFQDMSAHAGIAQKTRAALSCREGFLRTVNGLFREHRLSLPGGQSSGPGRP